MQDRPLNMLAAPYDQSTPDNALLAQFPAAAAGELFSTVSIAECEEKSDTLQSAISCADPTQKNVQQLAMPQSLDDLPASAFPAPGQQSCKFLQTNAAADFVLWQKDAGQESYSGSVPVSHSQQCSSSLNITRQPSSSGTPAEDSCAKAFSLSDWNPVLCQPQAQLIPDSAWHIDAAYLASQSSSTSGKTSLAIADALLNDLFPQPRASLHTPDMQPALFQPGSLASRNVITQQSISPNSAPLFTGESIPRDAYAKFNQLLAIFCDLPEGVIENALQQAAYDVGAASYQLQVWLGWECRAKDDGGRNASDAVAPSAAAAGSHPLESEPPLQAQQGALLAADSETVQDASFKHTLVKLKQQFHQLSSDEVLQYLDASAGNYHTAFALIQQCLGEDLDEQDSAKQALELTDLAVAQQLQKEEDSSPKSVLDHSASSSAHGLASMQETDAKRPVTEDPSMQCKMDKLTGQFPHVSYGRLQHLLAAHEGCIIQTSRVLRHESTTSALGNPNKKPGFRPRAQATPVGSVLDPTTGLPLWSSLGAGNSAPGSASASKGLQKRSLKTERSDLSCGARDKFTEAKEQITVCKREFYAAMRAGDVQKQRLYESWVGHWHHKLAEEKRAAQKKIQPTKNAEHSNTFKLDLHALHVDEALEEVAKTISDLSKIKCIWKVEVVTGKGLHSVNQNPKLLPAVKQYLAARLMQFWDAPGRVVFMLRRSID
ncbi:TPA: hypothetical protein ACH3X2_014129 [Trebouxia sp. C0005]